MTLLCSNTCCGRLSAGRKTWSCPELWHAAAIVSDCRSLLLFTHACLEADGRGHRGNSCLFGLRSRNARSRTTYDSGLCFDSRNSHGLSMLSIHPHCPVMHASSPGPRHILVIGGSGLFTQPGSERKLKQETRRTNTMTRSGQTHVQTDTGKQPNIQ